MSVRHVLTVNQVLEIMLRWLEVQDWEKAFMEVIPRRKLPQLQNKEVKEHEVLGEGLKSVSESDDGEGSAAEAVHQGDGEENCDEDGDARHEGT